MSNRKTLLPFIMFGIVLVLTIQLADNRYIPYTPYYPIHPYHEGGGHLTGNIGPNGQPIHSMMPYDHFQPIWTPHGTFFDQRRKVLRILPGGGVPVIVDYEKRCSDGFVGVKKHPDHPQYYYACKSDCVIFGKCQDYQFFDANKGQCVPYPLPRFTPVCAKPGHFPVYSNCTLYYTCDCNLQSEIFSCPPNTIFSSAQGECINGRQCPPTEIAQGSYIPENCEQKYPPCLENGTFRSPMDCSLYYKCVKQTNGVFLQTRFKCPGDTLFDTDQELCLPRQKVPCDRIQIAHLVYPAPSHKSYPRNYYPYVADSEEIGDFTVSQPKSISCSNNTSDEDIVSLESKDLIISTTESAMTTTLAQPEPTTTKNTEGEQPITTTTEQSQSVTDVSVTTSETTIGTHISPHRARSSVSDSSISISNTIEDVDTSSTADDPSSISASTTEQIVISNTISTTEQTTSISTTGQLSTSDPASTSEQISTSNSASTTEQISTSNSASTTEQISTSNSVSTTEQMSTSNSASTTEQMSTSNSASTTEQISTSNSASTTEQISTSNSASTTEQISTSNSVSTTGQMSTSNSASTTEQISTSNSASMTEQISTSNSASTTEQIPTSNSASTTEQISTSNSVSTTDQNTTSNLISTTEQITTLNVISTTEQRPTATTESPTSGTEMNEESSNSSDSTTEVVSSTDSVTITNVVTQPLTTTPASTDTQAKTLHSNTNTTTLTTTAQNLEVLRDSRSIDSIAKNQQVSANTSIPHNISDDSDSCCSHERMVLDDEFILDHSGSPEEYTSLEEDTDYTSESQEFKSNSLPALSLIESKTTNPQNCTLISNSHTINVTENSKPLEGKQVQYLKTENSLRSQNTTERLEVIAKEIQTTTEVIQSMTNKDDDDINERQVLSHEIILKRTRPDKTIINIVLSSTEPNPINNNPLQTKTSLQQINDSMEEYDSQEYVETEEDTTVNHILDISTEVPKVQSTEATTTESTKHIISTIDTNTVDNSNEKQVLSDEIVLRSTTPATKLLDDNNNTNILEKQNPSTNQSQPISTEEYDSGEYVDEEENTERNQELENSTPTSPHLETTNISQANEVSMEQLASVETPRPFQDKDTLTDQDNIMILTKNSNPILQEALDINTEILADVKEVPANTTVEQTSFEKKVEEESHERKVLSDDIIINVTTVSSKVQNSTFSAISTTEFPDGNSEATTKEPIIHNTDTNFNSSSENLTSFEYETEEVDDEENESQERKVLSDEVILNTTLPPSIIHNTDTNFNSSGENLTSFEYETEEVEYEENESQERKVLSDEVILNTTLPSSTTAPITTLTEPIIPSVVTTTETSIVLNVNHNATDENHMSHTTEETDTIISSYEEVDDDNDDDNEDEFHERQILSDEIIISSTSLPSMSTSPNSLETDITSSSTLIIETTTQQPTLATLTTQNILDEESEEDNSHEILTTPRPNPENSVQTTHQHISTQERITNTTTHLVADNTTCNVTQINVHMRESQNKSDTNTKPVNNTNIIIGNGTCIKSPHIPTLNLTIYGDLNLHIRFCPRPCNKTHEHNYEKTPILDAVWDSNASNKTMNLQAIS